MLMWGDSGWVFVGLEILRRYLLFGGVYSFIGLRKISPPKLGGIINGLNLLLNLLARSKRWGVLLARDTF